MVQTLVLKLPLPVTCLTSSAVTSRAPMRLSTRLSFWFAMNSPLGICMAYSLIPRLVKAPLLHRTAVIHQVVNDVAYVGLLEGASCACAAGNTVNFFRRQFTGAYTAKYSLIGHAVLLSKWRLTAPITVCTWGIRVTSANERAEGAL